MPDTERSMFMQPCLLRVPVILSHALEHGLTCVHQGMQMLLFDHKQPGPGEEVHRCFYLDMASSSHPPGSA